MTREKMSPLRARMIEDMRIRGLAETTRQEHAPSAEIVPLTLREPCPDCGGPMRIIETFRRGEIPRSRAPPRKQAA